MEHAIIFLCILLVFAALVIGSIVCLVRLIKKRGKRPGLLLAVFLVLLALLLMVVFRKSVQQVMFDIGHAFEPPHTCFPNDFL
jgi:hypothetical protein